MLLSTLYIYFNLYIVDRFILCCPRCIAHGLGQGAPVTLAGYLSILSREYLQTAC